MGPAQAAPDLNWKTLCDPVPHAGSLEAWEACLAAVTWDAAEHTGMTLLEAPDSQDSGRAQAAG